MYFTDFMPELPEVETIVRELKKSAINKTIKSLDCRLESSCVVDSKIRAGNLKILDIERRGKFIVMILENNLRLTVHLRMTGRLMWHVEKGREKYVRVVINFTGGTALYFSDVRKFGRVWLCRMKDFEKVTGVSRLGIEPFGSSYEDFEKTFFRDRLGRRKRGFLKNNLLRQDLIAGVGNIYADEICFRSGLHPLSRIEKIPKNQFIKVYQNVLACLEEGISHCGVSVSDFVGTKGNLGKHQNYLKIYGRAGDECYECGSEIKKIRVAGRGTHVCKKCQVLK